MIFTSPLSHSHACAIRPGAIIRPGKPVVRTMVSVDLSLSQPGLVTQLESQKKPSQRALENLASLYQQLHTSRSPHGEDLAPRVVRPRSTIGIDQPRPDRPSSSCEVKSTATASRTLSLRQCRRPADARQYLPLVLAYSVLTASTERGKYGATVTDVDVPLQKVGPFLVRWEEKRISVAPT